MKKFEYMTHFEKGVGAGFDFSARLIVHAGVPERGTMFALSYGVERGEPVVTIEQKYGDQKSQHRSLLQAFRPSDARALAKLLLEAADYAESEDEA